MIARFGTSFKWNLSWTEYWTQSNFVTAVFRQATLLLFIGLIWLIRITSLLFEVSDPHIIWHKHLSFYYNSCVAIQGDRDSPVYGLLLVAISWQFIFLNYSYSLTKFVIYSYNRDMLQVPYLAKNNCVKISIYWEHKKNQYFLAEISYILSDMMTCHPTS